MLTVKNSAPMDAACSATVARVSKMRTTAPSPRAQPAAASPATPPPMTSTLTGEMRPAAVDWPAMRPGKAAEASMTAREPATLA